MACRAHKLCFYAKKTHDAKNLAQENLTENLKEYLHFEAQLLPTRAEIEKFYEDIATLENDVDRLEAKINKH